jgi:hypothetical protein
LKKRQTVVSKCRDHGFKQQLQLSEATLATFLQRISSVDVDHHLSSRALLWSWAGTADDLLAAVRLFDDGLTFHSEWECHEDGLVSAG